MQILKAVKRCRKQHITPHQVNGGNKVITAPERPRRTPLLITTLPTFVYFLYQSLSPAKLRSPLILTLTGSNGFSIISAMSE